LGSINSDALLQHNSFEVKSAGWREILTMQVGYQTGSVN